MTNSWLRIKKYFRLSFPKSSCSTAKCRNLPTGYSRSVAEPIKLKRPKIWFKALERAVNCTECSATNLFSLHNLRFLWWNYFSTVSHFYSCWCGKKVFHFSETFISSMNFSIPTIGLLCALKSSNCYCDASRTTRHTARVVNKEDFIFVLLIN